MTEKLPIEEPIGFLSYLVVKDTGIAIFGREIFEVQMPLIFIAHRSSATTIQICVPAGYRTDFASVPRFLWWLFPPSGPYGKATVIHDYMLDCERCDRFLADAMFRAALTHLKVCRPKKLLLYYAVRWFSTWTIIKNNILRRGSAD